MSEIAPLGARASQIRRQIAQLRNTPLSRLQHHSDWQAHHIAAIESQLEASRHEAMAAQTETERLHAEIHQRDQQIGQLTSQQTRGDVSIPPQMFDIQNDMLEQLKQQTAFLQAQLQQQQHINYERDRKLEAIYHSDSWQLTGPLRTGTHVAAQIGELGQKTVSTLQQANSYINDHPQMKQRIRNVLTRTPIIRNAFNEIRDIHPVPAPPVIRREKAGLLNRLRRKPTE